jgi:3-oxoacyl-(acyl-carrier-protein) synthase
LTVQALLDGQLPPTAGFVQTDPACAISPTTERVSLAAKTALSTSLAFGGGNAALVLKGVDA